MLKDRLCQCQNTCWERNISSAAGSPLVGSLCSDVQGADDGKARVFAAVVIRAGAGVAGRG